MRVRLVGCFFFIIAFNGFFPYVYMVPRSSNHSVYPTVIPRTIIIIIIGIRRLQRTVVGRCWVVRSDKIPE